MKAAAVDPKLYRSLSCEQIYDQIDRTEADAIDAAAKVDRRFADNAALIVVSGMVWPAALALRADGEQAERLGRLKGEHDALTREIGSRPCPRPASLPNSGLAAKVALSPGDRFTYQLTSPASNSVRVEVTRVRTGRIEFDGGSWAQDLAGNRLPPRFLPASGAAPMQATPSESQLPYVLGLLTRDLRLGQSTRGVLVPPGEVPALEVSGQVVAVGPATLATGSVPSATIELEGAAVEPIAGNGAARVTVHGVLVVDSRNGMLVRLQMQPSAAFPEIDVKLVRIERSAGPPPM